MPYTFDYSERDIDGIAVHGVVTVYNSSGNVIKNFEGLLQVQLRTQKLLALLF